MESASRVEALAPGPTETQREIEAGNGGAGRLGAALMNLNIISVVDRRHPALPKNVTCEH
jgi:hypothetical protein